MAPLPVGMAVVPNTVSPCPHRLRELHEAANQLEYQVAHLQERLHVGDQELARSMVARAEAVAAREQAATSKLQVGRRARKLKAHLVEVVSQLGDERQRLQRHESDNSGLRRTLRRLEERLAVVEQRVSHAQGAVTTASVAGQDAEVEEDSLRQELTSMANLRNGLSVRHAREREKRLALKEAVRLKLKRVEETKEPLREELRLHDLELERLERAASEQEAATRAAEARLLQLRDEARRAAAHTDGRLNGNREIHMELVDLQYAHKQHCAELVEVESKRAEIARNEAEAQQAWRRRHLDAVDARVEARQRLDKDVVVAEAGGRDEAADASLLIRARPRSGCLCPAEGSAFAGVRSSATSPAATFRLAETLRPESVAWPLCTSARTVDLLKAGTLKPESASWCASARNVQTSTAELGG